ncbi:hypothetical protein CYR23_00230 [Chimaeribacter arupi]|nr:hypothetical protein CYR23_00230 [Chimaeribacter arupi]
MPVFAARHDASPFPALACQPAPFSDEIWLTEELIAEYSAGEAWQNALRVFNFFLQRCFRKCAADCQSKRTKIRRTCQIKK